VHLQDQEVEEREVHPQHAEDQGAEEEVVVVVVQDNMKYLNPPRSMMVK